MYCPHCGAGTHERTLLDPNLHGFVCDNGHRLYTPIIAQVGVLPMADTIKPPPISGDIDILRFWLTNVPARQRVPDDLALLCRLFVEMVEGNPYDAADNMPFTHCLKCGEAAEHTAAGDPYMTLLRCARGHEYWWRGYTLHYTDNGVKTTISRDITAADVPRLFGYYAHDELVRPWVHPQLRDALVRFHREWHHGERAGT